MKIPEGWQLVPVELTAENGMKAALTGEFSVPLPVVGEDGNEQILNVNVPWTVIKQIHRAMIAAAPTPPAQHTDDDAVDRFALAMKAKLSTKRDEGRSGWDNPTQCSISDLQDLLNSHIAKGDPVDVGNFAMMLWNRGGSTTPPAQEDEPVAWLIEYETTISWEKTKCKSYYGHNAIADYKYVDPNATATPLYTRPDNGELRKAAEEVVNFYDVVDSVNEERVIENLRNALKGKS